MMTIIDVNRFIEAVTKDAEKRECLKLKRENEELKIKVHALELQVKALKSALPHPCDGDLYKDWTPDDFFQKVTEEYGEMVIAFRDRKRASAKAFETGAIFKPHIQLMKEGTDLIIATTGLMERMGADADSRAAYMRQANKSNATRDDGRRFKHD